MTVSGNHNLAFPCYICRVLSMKLLTNFFHGHLINLIDREGETIPKAAVIPAPAPAR